MDHYIAHATIETGSGEKIRRGDFLALDRFSGQELEDLLACGALSMQPLPDERPQAPAPQDSEDIRSSDAAVAGDELS